MSNILTIGSSISTKLLNFVILCDGKNKKTLQDENEINVIYSIGLFWRNIHIKINHNSNCRQTGSRPNAKLTFQRWSLIP